MDFPPIFEANQSVRNWSTTEKVRLARIVAIASDSWNHTHRINNVPFEGFSPALLVDRTDAYWLLSGKPVADSDLRLLAYDLADPIFFQAELSDIAKKWVPITGKHLGVYAESMIQTLLENHSADMDGFREMREDLVRYVYQALKTAKGPEEALAVIADAAHRIARDDLSPAIKQEDSQIAEGFRLALGAQATAVTGQADVSQVADMTGQQRGAPISLADWNSEFLKHVTCFKDNASVETWADSFGNAKSSWDRKDEIDLHDEYVAMNHTWVFSDGIVTVFLTRVASSIGLLIEPHKFLAYSIVPAKGRFFDFKIDDFYRSAYKSNTPMSFYLSGKRNNADVSTILSESFFLGKEMKGALRVGILLAPFKSDILEPHTKKVFNEDSGTYVESVAKGCKSLSDLHSLFAKEAVTSIIGGFHDYEGRLDNFTSDSR